MLRHEPEDERSTFAAVLEPHSGTPFLNGIERLAVPGATLALRVRTEDRTDLIIYGAPRPITVGDATFQGELGVLSLRGERVEHAYALGLGGWRRGGFRLPSGPAQTASLRAVVGDALVIDPTGRELPQVGQVVRLLTADGWVYPYTVLAAEQVNSGVRLQVKEGPGITFDPARQRLEVIAYPQRVHAGVHRIEWASSRSR